MKLLYENERLNEKAFIKVVNEKLKTLEAVLQEDIFACNIYSKNKINNSNYKGYIGMEYWVIPKTLQINGLHIKEMKQGTSTELLNVIKEVAIENEFKEIRLYNILTKEQNNLLTQEERINIFTKIGNKIGIKNITKNDRGISNIYKYPLIDLIYKLK